MTDPQTALPLEASPTIELILSDDQIERFAGLIALQRLQRGSVIFLVLASSYLPSEGRGILRLQAKLCGKKSAVRALKILRSVDATDKLP